MTPKTLADRPIADRRGDDALDRHTHHVIDHPQTPDESTEDVVIEQEMLEVESDLTDVENDLAD